MLLSLPHLVPHSYNTRPGVAEGDTSAGQPSTSTDFKREMRAGSAERSAEQLRRQGAGHGVATRYIANIVTPLLDLTRSQHFDGIRRKRYIRRMKSGEVLKGLYTDGYTFEKIYNGQELTLVNKHTGEIFAETLEKDLRRPRPSTCGWAIGKTADVAVREDGRAHFQNVELCGSIHACPHCAAIIRSERADEIRQAVEGHQAQGGSLLFLTLTIRHHQGDSLDTMLNATLEGWRKLINGSPFARWKNRLKINGYVRSLEVTISRENSWHPHVHALLFLEKSISDAELNGFTDWLYERWADKVVDLGAKRPDREHGIKMLRVDSQGRALSKYLAKVQEEENSNKSSWDVGAEMGRTDVKTGRSGSLVPFQLLESQEGFSREYRFYLWREYYLATKNRRAITWSRGLKVRFGIEDKDDEEIISETESSEVVFSADTEEYGRLLRTAPEILALILEYAEAGRIDLISRFLTPVEKQGKPGTDSPSKPAREQSLF